MRDPRRPIIATVALLALPLSSRAGDDAPAPVEAPAPILIGGKYEVEVVPNIAYVQGEGADERKHKLDLFLPKGTRDFPVAFFIHGGGWTTGDRKLYGAFGRTFARNGIAAVVISYRLSPQVQHPGHIEDVARAFAWTSRHIARYGGRPDRIFVTGQSAGGHLAALLATDDTHLKALGLSVASIRGVMPVSGIYEFAPRRFTRVIGDAPNAARSASPIFHVTGKEPPFLVLYADRDFPTCDQMSRRFRETLHEHKVAADLQEIPNRNHITIMLRLMLDEADPATQALLKFIARHSELKLEPRRESSRATTPE